MACRVAVGLRDCEYARHRKGAVHLGEYALRRGRKPGSVRGVNFEGTANLLEIRACEVVGLRFRIQGVQSRASAQ